jgi:hypothetical protein
MRKTADVLEGLTSLLANAYADRTKKKKKEILALMDKESWYYGEEILENGFIDEIIEMEDNSKNKKELLALAKETFSSTMDMMKIKSKENENSEALAFLKEREPKNKNRINALNAKLKLRLKEIK